MYENPDDYNDQFMRLVVDLEARQAHALGDFLNRLLNPFSVIDVGCGPGIYLLPFRDKGCKVLGIDGSNAAGRFLNPDEFRCVDLRDTKWTPDRPYDLALCIEVGEHLPAQYADKLVNLLCCCANDIYFCAAHPGQGGMGHFNEQPLIYWLAKFRLRNYDLHPRHVTVISELESNPAYREQGWLIQNSMLLHHE